MSCHSRRRKVKKSGDIQSSNTASQSKSFSPEDKTASTSFLSTNAENDRQVVEWWRSHQQQESDIDDFIREREQLNLASKAKMNKEEVPNETLLHNIPTSAASSRFPKASEGSQPWMKEIQYDFLSKPQNGMVLDPRLLPTENINDEGTNENPSLGIFVTPRRSYSGDGKDRIEFFQPQVVQKSRAKQQNWKPQPHNTDLSAPSQSTDVRAAAFTSTRKEREEGYFSAAALTNKESTYQLSPERRKIPDTSSEVKTRRKLSLSEKLARKSKAANVTEFSDHLSDLPSDIDSITRERYLLACQMLKMSIIQKESALVPIEKDYILSLLNDFESQSMDGSDLTEDHISSIERAVLQLENDSMSRFPHDAVNTEMPSPTSAARVQKAEKASESARRVTPRPPRNDKNPHTSTRSPKKFTEHISNACNPVTPTNIFGSKIDSPRNDASLLDDDSTPENAWNHSPRDTHDLVRFDGWSFQNSMEYPFLMLDADRNHKNPRVFTPGIMEALRGFMPMQVMDHNFWLRFSLARDGRSFSTLLASFRASTFTMIGIETNKGEVFGSFTGSPWRIGSKWYGSKDAFLWRLKRKRYTSRRNLRKPNFEREIEVYPCTEDDDLVQYCTSKTIAVGGGEWQDNTCPYSDSGQGIGLVIDGDLAGGETNSCATFANPKLARYASTSSEFVITNLEVWSLTPCINVEDATKMEMREFFVKGY